MARQKSLQNQDFYKRNYMVKLFKILGNAKRLQILQLLDENKTTPLTVNDIARRLRIAQANLSTHLVRMRENGLIKAKQDGLNMYYSIKDENAIRFIKMIEK
jgi:DNA-binding transcriptional ArsR family regulator